MLDFARHVLRLGRIGWTLARHDALWPLELAQGLETPAMLARLVSRKRPGRRRGQRLAAALQALGPTFVKFGQALSTRADLLGEDVADDLADLQDHLPALPFETMRERIEAGVRTAAGKAVPGVRDRSRGGGLHRAGPPCEDAGGRRGGGQDIAAGDRAGHRERPAPLPLGRALAGAAGARLEAAAPGRCRADLRGERAHRDGPAPGGGCGDRARGELQRGGAFPGAVGGLAADLAADP